MSGPAPVTMPRLSDSMEEGTLLAWLKADGEEVAAGDDLAEIESDKASSVYAADQAGTLTIVASEGETVAVGGLIAYLGDGATPPAPAPSAPGASGGRPKASPVARRVAAQHGVDLATIAGSGPHGRIVRADVESRLAAPGFAPLAAPDPGGTRGAVATLALSRAQAVVARRMTASRTAVPDFEIRMTVDAEPATALRARIKEQGTATVPSMNDFVIKAAALALRDVPRANGSHRGEHWELYGRVNVGFAVAADDGLLVPVIADADRRSLGEIARSTRDLATRAREGTIAPRELEGGTFTVSNLGMFGVDGFSAVISAPQAAILAVGAARPAPVVREGAVVAGLVMELGLSCDHRILYGADGARLLGRIRDLLERPLALLMA